MHDPDEMDYTTLFDDQGELYAVLLTPALWEQLKEQAEVLLGRHREPEPPSEPLKDWENLKAAWDFKYPVDTDVRCGVCGASTEDWQRDEPRKFLLKTANFTGIVSFQCLQCKAKIFKKHFTDKITVETQPYQESKTYKFDAYRER